MLLANFLAEKIRLPTAAGGSDRGEQSQGC